MTGLADLIARRIRATGPLTVAEFMAEALQHPRLGYYATRDPFGAKGDSSSSTRSFSYRHWSEWA